MDIRGKKSLCGQILTTSSFDDKHKIYMLECKIQGEAKWEV